MKVIVDEMPMESEQCIFSELIEFTSRHKCMFQHGLYSRCNLETGESCPFLKVEKDYDGYISG